MQCPAPTKLHVLCGLILVLATACAQPSGPVTEAVTAPDTFCLLYEPIDATGLAGPAEKLVRIDENDAKWLELCSPPAPVNPARKQLAALHPMQ